MQHRGMSGGHRAHLSRGIGSFARVSLLIASLGALACACAPTQPRAALAKGSSAELIEEGRRRGFSLEDPLEIDPSLIRETAEKLGTWGDPDERLRRLMFFLNDSDGFEYAPNLSLTAEEAYRQRRGDCMAYANLFIALGRGLGLPLYFVHVSEVLSHYEHKGQFFTSSHVAVGYGSGPSSMVIDFTKESKDWKLSIYRAIDDASATALYYNNVAVDSMMAGRLDEAEGLLEYLLGAKPQVDELYNNLGVLLNRRGRYAEALTVLQKGIARSPEYKPFFTNGLQAARGAGRADIAAELEQRGQAIAQSNPYFIFARGMGFYQKAQYTRAAEELERAASVKPDSPVIYAWITRAWMSAGERERGLHAFAEARRLAPKSRLLSDLQEQFPELR